MATKAVKRKTYKETKFLYKILALSFWHPGREEICTFISTENKYMEDFKKHYFRFKFVRILEKIPTK